MPTLMTAFGIFCHANASCTEIPYVANSKLSKLSSSLRSPRCTEGLAGEARLQFNSFSKKANLSQLVYSSGKRTLFKIVFGRVLSSMSKFPKQSE